VTIWFPYRRSIVAESLSPTIFQGIFYIWVTTLTSLGHVTSSVTWPFDSSGAISYGCYIVTESLSPTIFEIMVIMYIWVTTLTFLGQVTSSVTWPIDPPYVISYWCPIVTEPLSLTVFEIFGPQYPCAHTHQHTQKHAASDFIFCPMQCIALDRQKLVTYRICIIREGCMSQLSPDCAPTCYSQDCITYKLPPYSILTAVYLLHNHQTNGWTERRVWRHKHDKK